MSVTQVGGEVGQRSGWLMTLSLTFVENKPSAISNNDRSTLTFDGEANRSCTHHNMVASQLLHHSQDNHCIQESKQKEKLLSTIIFVLL